MGGLNFRQAGAVIGPSQVAQCIKKPPVNTGDAKDSDKTLLKAKRKNRGGKT